MENCFDKIKFINDTINSALDASKHQDHEANTYVRRHLPMLILSQVEELSAICARHSELLIGEFQMEVNDEKNTG